MAKREIWWQRGSAENGSWGNGMKKYKAESHDEENKYHIVKFGDTLSKIAAIYGTSYQEHRKVERKTTKIRNSI
ncbi:MAG: LysM peptidoglycan-binding domain-containing protein [Coprococcus sp.]